MKFRDRLAGSEKYRSGAIHMDISVYRYSGGRSKPPAVL